jgi:hypothetical protein
MNDDGHAAGMRRAERRPGVAGDGAVEVLHTLESGKSGDYGGAEYLIPDF